ncbi:hypothetical protein CHUAL_010017 [Chamberlinius hualienensis]
MKHHPYVSGSRRQHFNVSDKGFTSNGRQLKYETDRELSRQMDSNQKTDLEQRGNYFLHHFRHDEGMEKKEGFEVQKYSKLFYKK